MKASELMEELLGWAEQKICPTVDTCKAGDPKKQVKRVGTCFIATPNVIARAAAWGADLLITHEPTYYDHWDEQEGREQERVRSIKKTLIEQSGMVLWRWHDHLHERMPDGIIEGQLKALGWKGAYDGRFEFLLEEAQSPRQIKAQLEEKWGAEHIRMVGAVDAPVKKIAMLIGCPGEERMMRVLEGDAELLIGGEVCEWKCGEYVRDAAQLGLKKAILICGHVASERAGMEHACRLIEQAHPELCCQYFECGEIYQSDEIKGQA